MHKIKCLFNILSSITDFNANLHRIGNEFIVKLSVSLCVRRQLLILSLELKKLSNKRDNSHDR